MASGVFHPFLESLNYCDVHMLPDLVGMMGMGGCKIFLSIKCNDQSSSVRADQ
jgi:hypothetical protein